MRRRSLARRPDVTRRRRATRRPCLAGRAELSIVEPRASSRGRQHAPEGDNIVLNAEMILFADTAHVGLGTTEVFAARLVT